MSRVELADAVNAALDRLYPGRSLAALYVDFRWVGKLERGEHRWPSPERRAALRQVLSAVADADLGLYSPRRTHPDRNGPGSAEPFRVPATTPEVDLSGLRACLDAFDIPPDGPVRPAAELRTAVDHVVRLRLTSNYRKLAIVIPALLDELHRAQRSSIHARREFTAALLTQAYRAADALADKFGHHDLSARIITMMTKVAQDTSDPTVIGTAQYVRGELFFHNGRPELGRMLLEEAATSISGISQPAGRATYGALHMRAAVLAGLARQPSYAHDHLREASECARRLPDGEYHGTAFGPSSVRIHEVTLALDSGEPDAALRAAAGWVPPASVPSERRSHFYIDLARAHIQTGSPQRAVESLWEARTAAPEHTRIHPHVRDAVSALRPVVASGSSFDEFATWAAGAIG
ncbi:hypothetical protein GCM10009541_54290 [Micromonospora gifhornensis]|uniref:Transcriptional regulator n=1 Tax=Micromonospora gifhornensis TaxID=84594 RepID=A0ABQ4IMV1_9ACTN|nr:hypothetical protein Vgi01_59300 [Micromonospora gifhornensis]